MNSFSEYMDKVKAEKDLKEKTGSFVRAALSNEEAHGKSVNSGLEFRREKFAAKKILITVSTVAACLILALGGNAYYHTPVQYVCLDINPSFELGINAFGRVVSSQAFNEDGIQTLEEIKYSNLTVEAAVDALVQNAAEEGFISEDGSTVIAVTAEGSSLKAAAGLRDSGVAGVNLALSEGGISAIVYADCADLELREKASEEGVSPGKLKLILILQTLDPGITVEDYKDAKITAIIAKANELLSQAGNSWQNRNDAETLGKIQNAARQVQAACENTEQEQNRNGGQNQSWGCGEQEQVQNQNQESNENSTQNQNQDAAQPTADRGEQPQNQDQSQGEASPSEQEQGQDSGAQSGNGQPAQGSDSGGQSTASPTEPGTAADGGGSSPGGQSGNGRGGR